MKHLLLTILITLFVFSCREIQKCDPNSPTLVGEWSWTKSEGGIGGGTTTPAITHETIVVRFTSDSTYKEYLNGSLQADSKFILAIDPKTNSKYLKFNGFINLNFNLVDCDNLILTERAADGYTHYYNRIQ